MDVAMVGVAIRHMKTLTSVWWSHFVEARRNAQIETEELIEFWTVGIRELRKCEKCSLPEVDCVCEGEN